MQQFIVIVQKCM